MKRPLLIALAFSLVVAIGHCDTVYYRVDDGSWAKLEAPAKEGRIEIEIGPQMAPGGEAILVVNKPEWMVLDDTAPPTLSGMKVNGVSRPSSTETLHLGCAAGDTVEVVFGIKDDKNPICAETASFYVNDAPAASVKLERKVLGPPQSEGRLVANISGLKPGAYEGLLTLTDMAPLCNSRSWPFDLTITGISISDDQQKVSLANAAGGFSFKALQLEQILLPSGMKLYWTGSMRGWLYPAEAAEAKIIKDSTEEKTVLITCTSLVDDKKNPLPDGNARIEYELTVRPDTPCLLVTSRVYNTADKEADAGGFWGWLPGAYFVTPIEGKQEWQGVARDEYIEIGKVGWVWLAPKTEGKAGLLWASDASFTQSRFDSMILKPTPIKLKTDEFIETRFAIAPAATAGEAEKLYKDLVDKGLVAEPPPPEKPPAN
jgi:hypothetical protein